MAISIDPRKAKKQNARKKTLSAKKLLSSKKAETNKSGLQTPGRSAKTDKY